MIEVFADVSCPFTHVGLRRLVERRDQVAGSDLLHVKAWPLELVNGEPLEPSLVDEEVAELRRHVAPDLFERFDSSRLPTSTLPALRLAIAAYTVDIQLGEQVSLAIRDALFEAGRDLSAPGVLAEIGAVHGIDASAVDDDAVVAEWREGQRRGVQGSPYFIVKGEGFFCPSLDIKHVGGHLQVRYDDQKLQTFLQVALG